MYTLTITRDIMECGNLHLDFNDLLKFKIWLSLVGPWRCFSFFFIFSHRALVCEPVICLTQKHCPHTQNPNLTFTTEHNKLPVVGYQDPTYKKAWPEQLKCCILLSVRQGTVELRFTSEPHSLSHITIITLLKILILCSHTHICHLCSYMT